MPRRTDIKKIMIIGSGPIVIGQACEFDYSGTQACKALKEEGYEVVLVNSQPGHHHDRPGVRRPHLRRAAHAGGRSTKIIERERPDALLPTLGGQTALNLAVALAESGVLEKLRRRADRRQAATAIRKAEDRNLFKQAMQKIGLDGAALRRRAHHRRRPAAGSRRIGFPAIIRPAFTLGGTGGGIAYNREEFERWSVAPGLFASPTHEVLIEESVIGWKEFELEVMRDRDDNVRHRLLDRELRPHGRAHRRLHHRGPGPDAHRQGVPADARRGDLQSSARSAWRPAARTSSSPSTRQRAAWWSSR